MLNSLTDITILAPNNDALKTFLGNTSVSDISPQQIGAILSYHVLNGTYYSDNVTDTPSFLPTLLNATEFTNVTGGQVVEAIKTDNNVTFLSGFRKQSNVTQANITFTGGVIHIIDEVLTIPLNLSATAIEANLTAAAGALTAANLTEPLDEATNITVFAPLNQGFADIANILQNLSSSDLSTVLQYHVLEGVVAYSTDFQNGTLETAGGETLNVTVLGSDIYVDSAKVVQPDVLIANGVVHVIDRVLNPNATSGNETTPNTSTTAPAFSGASTLSNGEIPFTSGVPAPTSTQTNIGGVASTSSSEQAGARVTAMVGMGALFGGAAILGNGF
uniref:FAS1 domain-containing protein n=1 Tax=Bionectria ochroleuca TaxID=29856 RepID=A0A8H7KDL8_BIOOC